MLLHKFLHIVRSCTSAARTTTARKGRRDVSEMTRIAVALFFVLAALTGLTGALTGCTTGPITGTIDPNADIVGLWQSSEMVVNGKLTTDVPNISLNFESDGTVHAIYENSDPQRYSWERNGSSVTVSIGDTNPPIEYVLDNQSLVETRATGPVSKLIFRRPQAT